MSKIWFLKALDRTLGRLSVRVLSAQGKQAKGIISRPEAVLIIRPGGIGDAVLLIPAISALRKAFPDVRLDILCERRNAGVFRICRGIDRTYLYDRGLGLSRCLRNRYDVVIDTEQWHRLSAVIAYLTGAPIRIGFETNERERMFTHRIPYSHDDYEVYSFLHLLEPLGIQAEFNADEPFIKAQDCSYTPPAGLIETGDKMISIFPGATVRERRWGGERFGMVAGILRDKGFRIVLLGSSSEREEAGIIIKYVKDCIDLTGKTDIPEVAAVLRMSRVLLTADSGLMHLAYAVGTPTVSLFGAGIEKKWAPRGKRHVVLNRHLPCSPCTRFGYTPRCRRNVECLSLIGVDEVVRAVESVI